MLEAFEDASPKPPDYESEIEPPCDAAGPDPRSSRSAPSSGSAQFGCRSGWRVWRLPGQCAEGTGDLHAKHLDDRSYGPDMELLPAQVPRAVLVKHDRRRRNQHSIAYATEGFCVHCEFALPTKPMSLMRTTVAVGTCPKCGGSFTMWRRLPRGSRATGLPSGRHCARQLPPRSESRAFQLSLERMRWGAQIFLPHLPRGRRRDAAVCALHTPIAGVLRLAMPGCTDFQSEVQYLRSLS